MQTNDPLSEFAISMALQDLIYCRLHGSQRLMSSATMDTSITVLSAVLDYMKKETEEDDKNENNG